MKGESLQGESLQGESLQEYAIKEKPSSIIYHLNDTVETREHSTIRPLA